MPGPLCWQLLATRCPPWSSAVIFYFYFYFLFFGNWATISCHGLAVPHIALGLWSSSPAMVNNPVWKPHLIASFLESLLVPFVLFQVFWDVESKDRVRNVREGRGEYEGKWEQGKWESLQLHCGKEGLMGRDPEKDQEGFGQAGGCHWKSLIWDRNVALTPWHAVCLACSNPGRLQPGLNTMVDPAGVRAGGSQPTIPLTACSRFWSMAGWERGLCLPQSRD